MEQSKTPDASGGIVAWLEERSASAFSDAMAHPAGSGNRNFYAAQAIAYENALSAALASAPPAPTPEAGSDPLVAYLERQ